MRKSTLLRTGLHVAIIMDGNGRWAVARGRPRTTGHIAGARAVRRVVESAPDLGIGTLTLYAFSADNWKRPAREVDSLLRLFRRTLAAETSRCVEHGIALRVIGRRDRLPAALRRAIEAAEEVTAAGTTMRLRVAVDYSARDAIVQAAVSLTPEAHPVSRDRFAEALGRATHEPHPPGDVDLLVRTGGEQRLSDFLLWECAYAELYFVPTLWPDFGQAELQRAVQEFHRRERRFGAVPSAIAG